VRHSWRLLALAALCIASAQAQQPSPNRDIFLYQGPDRAARLESEAKREGTVVLYSTMTLDDANPLLAAFEKKYGIKVNMWRAFNQKLIQRALAEARAGQYPVDVYEGNGPALEIMQREGLLEKFWSPAFADIPADAFPRHGYYAPDNLLFTVMGYNTRLVKPEDVPRSYDDLLQPKWRGRLGIESSNVAWFMGVTKAMGEEKGLAYFRKLAAMQPQVRSGHTLLTELMSAGEIPVVVTLYNQGVDRAKKKGAPVEWRALEPAFGRVDGIAVAKRAPHPHAALLFVDFVLSPEGQRIVKDQARVPVNRKVPTAFDTRAFHLIDSAALLDEWDTWEKRWNDMFLKDRRQ